SLRGLRNSPAPFPLGDGGALQKSSRTAEVVWLDLGVQSMPSFHHRKLPAHSTLLSGRIPRDEDSFQSVQLQVWYNHIDESRVGDGEQPHFHKHSDECFIVLSGVLTLEVDGQLYRVGPREFCCFPAGLPHAIKTVEPPLETLMIRAPSVDDKVYPSPA